MSLLEMAMEPCVILDKTTVKDGYGGVRTVYVDGAPIDAAFSFDGSTQARIGAVEGANDRFQIITKKNVVLQYHDVIKRNKNGKTYRITSNGDDHATPESAALDARAVSAEEYEVSYG